jgi:hypothetical protein
MPPACTQRTFNTPFLPPRNQIHASPPAKIPPAIFRLHPSRRRFTLTVFEVLQPRLLAGTSPMKSEKSSLKKVVKGVTDSLRKRGSAVAKKLTAAPANGRAPAPSRAASSTAATASSKPAAKASPAPAPAPKPSAKPTTPAPAPAPTPVVAAAAPKPAAKSPAPRKAPLEVPPILLEGDQPTTPSSASGPGQRYALGPTPPAAARSVPEAAELPEAYGTKRLILTARDPHWLYARWDLTRQQQRDYNALSVDHHLVVRVFRDAVRGEPASQIHVHPESNHWFIHVDQAGSKFVAVLGYYQANGHWVTISASDATLTPPDTMSDDTSAQFATIPFDVPFADILALAGLAVRENIPLAEIIAQLRAHGHTGFNAESVAGRWTLEQERALASIISMDSVRRVWMGSLEITELIRRQLQIEMSSLSASQFGVPTSPIGGISSFSSLSSPFGVGAERQKGFWFNVNAELILYGATEPDATVTIGGRVIRLRPDGSFSYRFSLPDGNYELPAVAVSADGTDGRAAEFTFLRATDYRGDVGTHPQDPALKPPLVANVA